MDAHSCAFYILCGVLKAIWGMHFDTNELIVALLTFQSVFYLQSKNVDVIVVVRKGMS